MHKTYHIARNSFVILTAKALNSGDNGCPVDTFFKVYILKIGCVFPQILYDSSLSVDCMMPAQNKMQVGN